jgi:stage II sporulation protein GA (sporulation sigma-E factor processing peptidase)
MNYLLLYFIGRYCNFKSKWWRVGLGATFGTLYVFAILLRDTSYIYSSLTKFLVSILMILIAFRIKTFKKLIRTIILFYIATFITSGGILTLFYLFNAKFENINGSFIIENVKPWHLIFGSLLCNVLIKIAFDFLDNYHKIQKDKINLKIVLYDKSVKLKALIDTGNCLKDPMSNKPVLIVYTEAIINILPAGLRSVVIEAHKEKYNFIEKLSTQGTKYPIRLIPYKTLGVENGTLLGLCVDAIEVKTKNKNVIINDGVIALYNSPISILDDYEALAYPEILNGGS